MTQFTFDSLIKFMSKEMEDDVSILVLKYETAREFADENEKPADIPEEGTAAEEVVQPIEEALAGDVAAEDATAPEQQSEVPEPVEGPAVEETEAQAEEPAVEAPSVPDDDFFINDNVLPDDPDIPDLSNLDEMIKNAGL